MAEPRTLADLQALVRQRLGWAASDGFVTDAELRDYIRDAQWDLYDLLIATWQGNFHWQKQTAGFNPITTTPDTATYDLPTNFYRLIRISVTFDGVSVPMRPLNPSVAAMETTSYSWDSGYDLRYILNYKWPGDQTPPGDDASTIEFHPIPGNTNVVDLRYHPILATLSASTGINEIGHDEYIVLAAMEKCLQKEESDTSHVERQLARYIQRIDRTAPPLDHGKASVIADERSIDHYVFDGRWRWGQ